MTGHRIMLKLSGEALASPNGGYNDEEIKRIAKQVKESINNGIQVGIVIGGGNYWRGRNSSNIDRTKADSIGMLATVMNCIYVSEIFRSEGMNTMIFTPFACGTMTELFSKDKANAFFNKGYVLFFAGGTGHPYFSTDTGIVLRAVEMDVDAVLLAKNIDGIYDSDPKDNPKARKYDSVSLSTIIEKQLKAIDLTAAAMALENKIPFIVFDLHHENAVADAIKGKVNGTMVTAD